MRDSQEVLGKSIKEEGMYPFDICSKRKQKPTATNIDEPDYMSLGSEPLPRDYAPGSHLSFQYQNHHLARRRLRRNIQRYRRGQQ